MFLAALYRIHYSTQYYGCGYVAPQEVRRKNVLRPQSVFLFFVEVSGQRPLVCFVLLCHRGDDAVEHVR